MFITLLISLLAAGCVTGTPVNVTVENNNGGCCDCCGGTPCSDAEDTASDTGGGDHTDPQEDTGSADTGDEPCDDDEDGYISAECGGDDCDDNDATVNPGVAEIWYDGIDSNCSGDSDFDQDGDGKDADEYGGTDCDDTDPDVSEGQIWYPDNDGDGYGFKFGELSCQQPPGFVHDANDCDDSHATVNPGAEEVCNGVDDNCDGLVDEECWCVTDC